MARISTTATKPWKTRQPFGLKDLLAYECPWKHVKEEHTAELATPTVCMGCGNTGKTLYGYCYCDYGTLAADADNDAEQDYGWRNPKG
jgi:hypothetical protein